MKQLLTSYSLNQIFIFIVLVAIAIKQLVNFIDWAKNRTRQAIKEKDKPEEIINIAEQHERQLIAIKQELAFVKNKIELLLESDRDDIKHSITKDHHYFCYKIGCIDDYSLDCIERKYAHYVEQGGNTFVKELMEDLRKLPRQDVVVRQDNR